MDLVNVLVPLLRNGTTESVQRLAYAHITRHGKARIGLAVALAGTANLAEDLAAALESHPDPEVRSALWNRDGADQQRLLARLGRETSGHVVAVMIDVAADQDAVAEVLRRHMKLPHAKGVMYQKAWHLPADVVTAAMVKVGRGSDRVVDDLTKCETHSAAALVAHPDVHPLLRLAACAAKVTPSPVVAKHVADIIHRAALSCTSVDDRRAFSFALAMISTRRPDTAVLAAVRSQDRHLQGRIAEHVLERFERWESEAERLAQVADLGEALAPCATPDDVRDLWATLAPERQVASAGDFAAADLCDAALMRQLCKVADPDGLLDQPEYRNPLWARQEKDLFHARARRRPRTIFGAVTAATNCPDSAKPATLIGWALDIQSELTLEWGNLLTHPAFPRERYAELPLGHLVFALQQCRDTEIAWVADAISDGLTHQATGREAEWAAVLDQVSDIDGSFEHLLDATTAILS